MQAGLHRTTINSCVYILSSLLFNLYAIVFILLIIYLHIIVSYIHLFKFTKRNHHLIHPPPPLYGDYHRLDQPKIPNKDNNNFFIILSLEIYLFLFRKLINNRISTSNSLLVYRPNFKVFQILSCITFQVAGCVYNEPKFYLSMKLQF